MAAPVIQAFDRAERPLTIIHTGQHYSENMDHLFFQELNIRTPDFRLPALAGPNTPIRQISHMLGGLDDWMSENRPAVVLVLGDTNSNFAAALVARKKNIKLGHIEAGERSWDIRSPEEQNRVMIDHISDFHFASTPKSRKNLLAEGINERGIYLVGHTLVDSLQGIERRTKELLNFDVSYKNIVKSEFSVITLHRQETVDDDDKLLRVLTDLARSSKLHNLPGVFFAHPRTLGRMQVLGISGDLQGAGIVICEGVGYIEFISVLSKAAVCITDSGVVQQEACILKVPTVTLMETTPWPETVSVGINRVVPPGITSIAEAIGDALKMTVLERQKVPNPFGDGRSGQRICDLIANILT